MIRSHRGPLHWAASFMLVSCGLLLGGCAGFYVDNGLRAADTVRIVPPPSPKPVQLFFTFETKGAVNARATDHVKGQVGDLVKQSGLFSAVKDVAEPGTGTLQITINDVPLSDNAFAKGFMTGLTLGLAGSTVGDGYACTLQYKRSDASPAIEVKASHAIYTSIGATSGPDAPATQVGGAEEAITTVVRQSVKTLLAELASDPKFQEAP